MKFLKSHFWYNKSQRNGIFFLIIIIIVVFQIIYVFIDFSSDDFKSVSTSKAILFQKQIDSLKQIENKKREPKIYPFNPNYITDFKGYQLGMSTDEIDRLHNFRKQNKWINSDADFQQVTKVSDSLLAKISPYFKFPEWVKNRNKKQQYIISSKAEKSSKVEKLNKTEKSDNVYPKNKDKNYQPKTTNINKATAEDFATINGIGGKLSERIVKYRKRLQGFSYDYQLYEVWGIDKEIIKKVLVTFKIVEKPIIKKININTASFKEVLKNPYIDYKLCKKIFDYRDEVAELQNISELKNIEGFPVNKYDRIVLYLDAE